MVKLPGKPLTPERVQDLQRQVRELSASTSGRVRTAQTTALSARTKAFEAEGAAVEARGIANTASETAGEASEVAGNASIAAGEAKAAVESLGTDFTERMATAAQNLADAKTALQADADAAAAAARAATDLAATKGENITQPSAPTGSRANPANLWIDNSINAAGVPKNQPNRYGPYTVPDPNAVALILPAASAQTETEVMRISVAPGASTPVALTLSASMALNGLVKSSIARLRDGLTGAVLASYVFSDKGDSNTGNQETWTLPAGFIATPTASVLVLTIQSNNANAPAVYSLHRTITASNWQAITDQKALDAAAAAATAATAAQAAKTVADQANTAAGVAKQAASDANTRALTAANLAGTKGQVIYQVSAPTGANASAANLWIRNSDNTPWTYDTTNAKWVQVTDKTATDAASKAAQAQLDATAAANAAKAAQDTANEKPLILFSSTAGPSGTAPTGSIWFLWDTSKNVAGQWLQSGTLASPVWTPQQIRSEVIANLDVAKLTAGSAAIAELVAQKIAAATGNFQTANVSNLFVTSGATMSQAVIDYLFANVVQAKKITAGMIDVDSLSGITLTGTVYRSAASGQRIEIQGTAIKVFDVSGAQAGTISGDAGGLRFNASQSKNFYVGAYNTGISYGTVGCYAQDIMLGVAFINDRMFDGSGNQWWTSQSGKKPRIDVDTIDATAVRINGTSILPADTGWITFNVTAGTPDSTYPPQMRRVGGQVYWRGLLSPTAVGQTVGTVPAGFRPGVSIEAALVRNVSTPAFWDVRIQAGGNMALLGPSGGSGAINLGGFPSYIAEN